MDPRSTVGLPKVLTFRNSRCDFSSEPVGLLSLFPPFVFFDYFSPNCLSPPPDQLTSCRHLLPCVCVPGFILNRNPQYFPCPPRILFSYDLLAPRLPAFVTRFNHLSRLFFSFSLFSLDFLPPYLPVISAFQVKVGLRYSVPTPRAPFCCNNTPIFF